MKQQDSYTQDITREIDGVIKAESDKDLGKEVSEFVVTAELMRPGLLPNLFKGLEHDGSNNCIWISGDFGSGKSHLLKILSYVLENNLEVNGEKCARIFAKKCSQDFELEKAVRDACSVPTVSILFNIQKNLDAIAKNAIDPVLAIFLKMFNKRLGYDEKKPAIAEIERYFESQGKYEWLKEEYRSRYGKEWTAERPSIYLKLDKLAAIFADMENIDQATALSNLKTQIDNYTIDTDGFVILVKDYLDKRSGTRLIFFVDEVGQFIGNDVHRMLSLQTIAECLGDMCRNRASIMVTSQMDMNAVIGDLTNRQKYDFSRIMARFKPLTLTSANADEVVHRRLLEKTPEAKKLLEQEYDKHHNILRSIFQFGEDSKFKSNYRSADDFVINFPFVDYQLNLIQQSIINLSKNNAFAGEKNSVGERSLLAIAHDVANLYKDCDMNSIVQFSDMYEGLESQLQTKIRSDIQQAERTLGDVLALKVLKTLFLLKYVAGFPATVDNLTKLMLPKVDADFPQLRSLVQEALNKLIRQSYIEKGAKGDYHFQTNEEKDIENEIKNQELSPDAVSRELMKMFRDEVFSDNKISLSPKKVFSFGRYVDDQKDGGGESDINIHFVTPNSGLSITDIEVMQNFSFQHPNQLCVVLPPDQYLPEDLAMFKKADSCLSRLFNSGEDGSYRQQIIADKRQINRRRRENIVNRLTEGTKVARLFLNGTEINVRATELKARLVEGMSQLIKQVYINLEMIDVDFDDDMLKQIINEQNTGFWGGTMDAAMTEVFNKVNRNKNLSIRSIVGELVKDFKGGTYGWYEMATLCVLVKLYKLDRISFRSGGNTVDERDLYRSLTNSNSRQTLIVDVEETISQSQISTLKKLYRDLFDDETCMVQGAREVHTAFIQRLNSEIQNAREAARNNVYAFAEPLAGYITALTELSRLVYPGLYSKKEEIEDAIDIKEDKVEPILTFIDSPQFSIFGNLNQLLTGNQANLTYVEPALMTTLTDIHKSTEPWKRMEEAKNMRTKVNEEITRRQDEERTKALAEISSKHEAIKALPAYETLKPDQLRQIETIFTAMEEGVRQERFIGNLIAYSAQVSDRYNTCLDTINHWVDEANRAAAASTAASSGTGSTGTSSSASASSSASRPIRRAVNKQKAFAVNYQKPMLETKEDVDDYIAALRTRLMKLIDEDTNIMLN